MVIRDSKLHKVTNTSLLLDLQCSINMSNTLYTLFLFSFFLFSFNPMGLNKKKSQLPSAESTDWETVGCRGQMCAVFFFF